MPLPTALLAVALQVQLSTPAAKPGDTIAVTIRDPAHDGGADIGSGHTAPMVSSLGGVSVPCYPAGPPGAWYAIHGVPVSAPAGRRDITVGAGGIVLRTPLERSGSDVGVLRTDSRVTPDVLSSVGSGTAAPEVWQGGIEILPVAPEEQRLTFVKKRRYLTDRLPRKKDRALKAALRSETGVRRWRDAFLWPVHGRTVANFGVKRVYNLGLRESWHKGLDLSVPWGTPVVAAASGTVALTGTYGANGRIVVLDHGHGVVTFYGHLSRIVVERGRSVSAGQVVGRVGSTGLSTAPHLHWGVYVHGVAVRPDDWTIRVPVGTVP